MASTIPHHEALLLLPPPPALSYSVLKAVYGPAISAALSKVSNGVRGTARSVVLDIAIGTNGLRAPESQPRSKYFERLQSLIAAIYRLIGVLSVAESVELDGPGGVDARLFFLDLDSEDDQNPDKLQYLGPIVGPAELAASRRSWNTVYSVGTEEGDAVLQKFVEAQALLARSDALPAIRKVPGAAGPAGLATFVDVKSPRTTAHTSVAVGGTFDHLHAGHKLLLTATVLAIDPPAPPHSSQPLTVTIGTTGDELLVNKKFAEYLETWEERWEGVWRFLRSIVDFNPPDRRTVHIERTSNPGPNGKYVIVTISPALSFRFVQIADPFGPTITDQAITSLVVSKETRSGGKAVNDEREKKGWAPLEVFEVDVLELEDEPAAGNQQASENFDSKISSTEIRRRRMNLAKGSL
jgi:phosphopantetheine adenylyltransferase